MNVLSSGNYDVYSDNGFSLGSFSSYSVTVPSYSNLTVSYTSAASDYFMFHINSTADSILNLVGSTSVETSVDFTCSYASQNNTYT